jgi:glycine dehydrogenase subunit 1
MALLGPEGLRNLGEIIMYRANYAMHLLSRIGNITVPIFKGGHFKEFTVNFDQTNLTVNEVNRRLLKHRIQGGKDLSKEFPELRQSALFCVTEIHSKEEIQHLANVLEEMLDEA